MKTKDIDPDKMMTLPEVVTITQKTLHVSRDEAWMEVLNGIISGELTNRFPQLKLVKK